MIRQPKASDYPKEIADELHTPLFRRISNMDRRHEMVLNGVTLASSMQRTDPTQALLLSLAIDSAEKDFHIYALQCRIAVLRDEIDKIESRLTNLEETK